jgi:hypothetical protein
MKEVRECLSHQIVSMYSPDSGEIWEQGDEFVVCLREIPSLYSKEYFALEERCTF